MNPKKPERKFRLPFGFQANRGQSATEAKFLVHSSGYNIFLTPSEIVIILRPPADPPIEKNTRAEGYSFLKNLSQKTFSFFKDLLAEAAPPPSVPQVRLKLGGANENPEVIGLEELPGKVNYFIGNDPSKWHTDISVYAKVKYSNVYPGIDIVYSSNQEQLEWDYIVHPGADPKLITIDIDGSEQLTLDAQGDLLLSAGGQQIRISKPVVYQKSDELRNIVTCSYMLNNKRQVSLLLDDYDTARTLIIDPVITYSTYLGGSDVDYGYHIAVDPDGNAYLTGTTYSNWTNPPGFPIKDAYQADNPGPFTNAFVSKISATGELIYSTYLGGTSADEGHGIAVDRAGSAYVTGQTQGDFPITNNAIQTNFNGYIDAFVTKLNPAGNGLDYSTYLGGSDGDAGFGIAVDRASNAYVTGYTESSWQNPPASGFPIQNPIQADNNNYPFKDVFITKINADGSLNYSTYLGGWRNDIGYAITVDTNGNAFITGSTESSPPFPPSPPLQGFPVTAGSVQTTYGGGATDAFITKLNADGTLGYSSYLGGASFDEGRSVAVDSTSYVYVTGFTASLGTTSPPGFPTQSPWQKDNNGNVDAFVTKINPTGNSLVFSTYLGGTNDDRGTGIAVDFDGNAYVTGVTLSSGTVSPPGFPIKNPIQSNNNGSFDIFIAKFLSTGSVLLYSTYLGGKGDENAPSYYGPDIAIDSAKNAYVTGSTWSTWKTPPSLLGPPGFPVVNPIQNDNYGAADVFVLKLYTLASLVVTKSGSPDPVMVGNNLIYQIVITNNGPDTATDIVLVDQLPPDVDFISASTGCSQAGGKVTCNLGTLEPNNSSTVTMIVQPRIPGVITNTATVTSQESSPTSTTTTTQVTLGHVYTNITIFRSWRKHPPNFL